MASGDTLFVLLPQGSIPTTTAYATLDILSEASTVVGNIPVLDFAGATADESAEWVVMIPNWYASTTGMTFKINYAMAGTDGSDVQFEVRALKIVAGETITSENIQAATATDITDTPNGTANVLDVTPTGAIAKADMGTPAAGDYLRIRLSRDYDHAANADDAQVLGVYVTET